MSRLFVAVVAIVLSTSACLQVRYVTQAAIGQLSLWDRARPVQAVLSDENTDERTRIALKEVGLLVEYAEARGLESKGNYRSYVELDDDSVVWFLAAAPALSLEPVAWSFPIVGSFPYLGWFDYREAAEIQRRLERDGLDVTVRTVRAYSTGGWFRDPVLSSMISQDERAYRGLVNVLFHELTHANILINDQSTFNESVASFVGDMMAEEYLIDRLGEGAQELADYRVELEEDREAGKRLTEVYAQLEKLYASERPEKEKLREKRKVLTSARDDLGLYYTPNNASLAGFKTYNSGLPEFAQLYQNCGRDWPRFFAAVRVLNEESFDEEQVEVLGPVIAKLVAAGCPQGAAAALEAPGDQRKPDFDPALAVHAARHHVHFR